MTCSRPPISLSRRRLLAASAGALALPLLPRIAAAQAPLLLRAAPAVAALQGDGKPPTNVWAFADAVPGPVLRVRQGEQLAARLENGLAEPTTIHWHGIRIANAMDGVPHMTQPAVAPGAGFDYVFIAPDAGTFWYHPHQHSFEQVARGLHGLLIVEEAEPPQVDRDLPLVIADWRLGSDGQLVENFGAPHDRGHAGRLGNTVTVNGVATPVLPVKRHERLRLRLANTSTARIVALQLENAAPKLIALDGQPINPSNGYGDALVLAPGNRADLMVDITATGGDELRLVDVREKKRNVLAIFKVDAGEALRPEPLVAPVALKPNSLPEPDLAAMRTVELVMSGGARDEHDMSMAMADGPLWQFNGVAGVEDAAGGHGPPLFSARRGETIALRIVNFTAWPHAMHIHGHHFRVIQNSSDAEPKPHWWDTRLMEARETMTFAFVADNPGKWMIHCHMLDHQAAGMMTWFEVS